MKCCTHHHAGRVCPEIGCPCCRKYVPLAKRVQKEAA